MSTVQLWLAAGVLLSVVVTEAIAGDAIYRCTVNGRLVLTDRANEAADCQSLDTRTSNTFTPEPVRQTTPKSAGATSARATSKPADSIAAEQLKAKQRCERIQQRLDQIADKMRSGYTAQQGEKLRAQRQQLEESRRIERCR